SCQTTIESSLFVHYRVIHAPQDVFALPSLPVPNRILCAHFARLKAYVSVKLAKDISVELEQIAVLLERRNRGRINASAGF
ncbi:MAG: hypothetical protein NTX50_07605, partial [Candidatus Sumerlaeota bacterium]|nr:hypothetical protein [Candidatus Sumerlaeota bacterium]